MFYLVILNLFNFCHFIIAITILKSLKDVIRNCARKFIIARNKLDALSSLANYYTNDTLHSENDKLRLHVCCCGAGATLASTSRHAS